MEKSNNATLILNDRSYITYSIPDTPRYTTDEVEFLFVTDDERLLICKDSFAEIVLRGDNVINKSILPLKNSSELDNIAKLYSKTFLTKYYQSVNIKM